MGIRYGTGTSTAAAFTGDLSGVAGMGVGPAQVAEKSIAEKLLESIGGKDKDNLLVKAGLLAAGGAMSGLVSASNTDKQIKAAKEMLETKEQQTVAAENRLAQRAAYGKVGKEGFGFKDTGLLAAAMKEKK